MKRNFFIILILLKFYFLPSPVFPASFKACFGLNVKSNEFTRNILTEAASLFVILEITEKLVEETFSSLHLDLLEKIGQKYGNNLSRQIILFVHKNQVIEYKQRDKLDAFLEFSALDLYTFYKNKIFEEQSLWIDLGPDSSEDLILDKIVDFWISEYQTVFNIIQTSLRNKSFFNYNFKNEFYLSNFEDEPLVEFKSTKFFNLVLERITPKY